MASDNERMHILQMIEDGRVTADEGLRLLNALTGPAAPASAGDERNGDAPPAAEPSPPLTPDVGRWRNWWKIPLAVGVFIIVVGGLLMYWAYSAGGFGFWFACATLPFTLGVAVAALAYASQTAKWIHVRIRTGDADLPRIAVSLPLPIRLTAWFFRVFGPFIPQLKDTGVDELILALADSATPDNPLYVDVQDGDEGEHVQVFIG